MAVLAWLLWGFSVCLVVVFAVLLAMRWDLVPASRAISLQAALLGIAYPLMGAIIASRRPRNPIGWIFLVIGLSTAGSAVANVLATDIETFGPHAPSGAIWGAWINQWVWAPGWISIPTFVLLLFPDGRLPHPRFGPIAWLAAVSVGTAVVGGMLCPDCGGDPALGYHNPVVVLPAWESNIDLISIGALLVAGLGSLVGLIYRFRRSRGDERQQLKWFAFAGLATIVLFFGLTVEAKTGLVQALGFLAIPLLPTAAAIAILKYHLYDIDRLISRAASYTVLLAVLGGTYAGLVIGLGRLLEPLLGGSDLVVAVSTLVVAALFQPVRRRIQAVLDRRFNRARYDAARTIDAFAARLREQVDIDALGAELSSVVGRTMQPSHVFIWLREATL